MDQFSNSEDFEWWPGILSYVVLYTTNLSQMVACDLNEARGPFHEMDPWRIEYPEVECNYRQIGVRVKSFFEPNFESLYPKSNKKCYSTVTYKVFIE